MKLLLLLLKLQRMSRLARFTEFGRKVVAVGRNYAEHAAELGNAVPTKPLLFMKVTQSSYCPKFKYNYNIMF